MIGRTVSHYRILEKLGEGGMGVVYMAEDLKLHRIVALKFLSARALGSQSAVTRFLHEARTAASLNHPNICTIHEVGEVEATAAEAAGSDAPPLGTPFIAMERIEGRLLASAIRSGGPMPLKQLLDTALQVAEGLAAAHAQGIVHRDLKPQNVMVTTEGRIKILDFGLAKPIRQGEQVPSDGTALTETISVELTRRGMVVGTVAYMSPEQAIGRAVDSRSDVFSFGTMLYEMATGSRPFKGETATATLAQVIEREPPLPSEIRRDLPPELERIILRCLSKDAADRYHDTRDLVVELRELRHQLVATTSGRRAVASLPRRGLLRVGVPVAVVLVLAAVAGWWWSNRHRSVSTGEVKATQLTALRAPIGLIWPALSPDGRKLAYIYKGDLTLVLLESGDVRTLLRAEVDSLSLQSVAWHPDSEQLLVEGQGNGEMRTWLVNVVTNRRRLIHLDSTATGPTMSPDGERVALLRNGGREIAVLHMDSDSLQVVRSADEGEGFGYPVWSPNGKRLAYPSFRRPAGVTCWTCDLAGNPTAVKLQGHIGQGTEGRGLCWLPDGRLVYALSFGSMAWQSALWAVRVDPNTGVTRGSPREVFDGTGADLDYLTMSADGERIAFKREVSHSRLQMVEMAVDRGRSDLRRLSVEDWPARTGVWSRDGRRIFFEIERNENQREIYVRNLDASREEPLVTGPGWHSPACLSPDGLSFLYWQAADGRWDLMSIPVGGGMAKTFARFGARKPDYILSAPLPGGALVTGMKRGSEIVIRRLDPDGISSPESLVVELGEGTTGTMQVEMDISPDGKQVVIVESTGRLRLVELQNGQIRELGNALPPWKNELGNVQYVSWSQSGDWLYFAGGGHTSPLGHTSSSVGHIYSVWRLSLDGGFRENLWQSDDTWPSHVRPSPDGRHVAFNTLAWENDVWMIDGF
jgi:eukaryotic-like serine/threonine-protein kinase